MKKIYRSLWLLAALAALVAVIACAPAAQTQPTAAPPTAATQATAMPAATEAPAAQPTTAPAPTGAEDTIVYLKNISDVVSMDPAQAYEFSGWLAIHNAYDTLVKFEGDDLTTLKPGLASEWTVTEDGDNWVLTFTLADGGKFASGNPITSADVVYSYQRAIALNKPPSFLWTAVGGLTPESITAPDEKTVVLTMPKTASSAEFLNVLTAPPLSIVDSELLKTHETQVDGANDWGNTWLSEHSAGSGPYVIDHWTKDVEFLLTANPNSSVQPAVANVLVKHVPEAANQQAQLEAGDADIAHDLTPEQIAALEGNSDVATQQAGNLQIFYIGMNAKMPPLDNNNVREAIRYAIDYDGIADQLLSGNAKVLQTVIPDGLMGANTDRIFTRDVEKAKQLLAEANVEPFTIDLLTLDGNQGIVNMGDLGAKLQADLAEIGITLNVQQQPSAELLGTYRAQNAPMVVLLWGPDYPDPNTNAGPFSDYAQQVIAWRNNWEDPKAAEMATAAKNEADPAKRVELYKELTDYVAHNGPYGVLFQPVQLFAMRNSVEGFDWNPMGYVDLWSVSK